jgi:hypothetical protein
MYVGSAKKNSKQDFHMIQLYQFWVYTKRDPGQHAIEMPTFTHLSL